MTPLRLQLHRVLNPIDAAGLVATKVPNLPPDDLPPGRVIVEDADTGHPILIVDDAPADLTAGCVHAFRTIDRSSVLRSAGIRTASNTFGYGAPNAVIQRNTPTASRWAMEDPEGHAHLDRFAEWAWANLHDLAPPRVLELMEATRDQIHPDWRLAGTPWTSGIANDTVPLYYHLDRNNVPDTWSVMLAARAGVTGGNLHIADYGFTVPIRDKTAYYFPGVNLVHGVTPIRATLRNGFRYTFVWYPVRRFVGMPSYADALTAAQLRRTDLETDQLQRQRDTGMIRGTDT